MNLCDMINEFLSIPEYEISVSGHDTSELNAARIAFLNSLRNTLHKEIDNSANPNEIKEIINTFEPKLEKSLIIALYRKYLWLEPFDMPMYNSFIKYIDDSYSEKKQQILHFVDNNEFDAALMVVESIFDNLFIYPTLIHPIKMRSLVNMIKEYCLVDAASRKMTDIQKEKIYYKRCSYLEEQVRLRIIDPKINLYELREFFSFDYTIGIVLYCDIGLAIAKRYLNANPTDREMYGYIFRFLSFWHLTGDLELYLQYVAVNDFDNALKFVNAVEI